MIQERTTMPTTPVRVDSYLLQQIEENKPSFLSTAAFARLLAYEALDTRSKLGKPQPASGHPQGSKVLPVLNKEEEERVRALSLEGMPIPPAQGKPIDIALETHTPSYGTSGARRRALKVNRPGSSSRPV